MTDRRRQPRGRRRANTSLYLMVGVVIVALITVVVLTFEESGTDLPQFGSPTVEGEGLPLYDDQLTVDPGIGMIAPTVVGADFEGDTVSITADGRPKMIVFLAHWCSHCQAEVPVIQAWVNAGSKPDGVDLYAVATGTAESRTNFPPSEWLEEEGWTAPIVVDDTAYSVGDAFGLRSFPFFVAVDGDGIVRLRAVGELPPEALTSIALAMLG